jgi:hypothetical protein
MKKKLTTNRQIPVEYRPFPVEEYAMTPSAARSPLLLFSALSLALSGCGGKDDAGNLAALDAQLTNNAADLALKGAPGDQIIVDPKLGGRTNRQAPRPADGAGPVLKGDAKAAATAALKLAGGTLLRAPAPVAARDGEPPLTPGARARGQEARRDGDCAAKLDYGMQWAQRLPRDLPLYPGARLTEAAGVAGDRCALRAASFVTAAPMGAVIDFYYTLARRGGYPASHEMLDGRHALGGVRPGDEGAYFIAFSPAPGGGTAVDLIANRGT